MRQVLKPGLKKGPWTPAEDSKIVECIQQGMTKWSEIAEHVPGRLGKQCRERWVNHLSPDVKKEDWTMDEDQRLVELQTKYGNRWKVISQYLPGRCVERAQPQGLLPRADAPALGPKTQ